MYEKAHIDGDIVAYRCGAATEHADENIARWQAGEMMNRILHETNSVGYNCFLTGSDNFRFDIYSDYKANRRDAPKPRHLGAIREYLVEYWQAKVTDGFEADDAMGMEQCLEPDSSIICSIDKDLLMIPGWHYNFVKQESRLVSPLEGLRHFYWQLIMGDRTDNIQGYDGKMRQKVPKFLESKMEELEHLTEEIDMYNLVKDMHYDIDVMHIMGKCLWIWRKENDIWVPPHERENDVDTSPS
jgi:5'-3' exonuclease